jgi:uncharacterized protein YbjT (DUF2867 family)
MKITVIGATGQVGSTVVELLRAEGHDVVAASRGTGADVLTGAGLAEALAGAQVLVDVVNSPSFEDEPVLKFFTASAANLTAAARAAGVGHYVALSIVGVDGLPDSGYMRAKVVQERTITDSGLPYTIVRATQFQEFAEAITGSLVVADDVAAEVARAAVTAPVNGIIDIGGPQKISFADMARAVLAKQIDDKLVVVDPDATYFGTAVAQTSLVTAEGATLAPTRFADWLAAR